MSNLRVENWINIQRKMVGPDAVSVSTVVLVGPDGDAWATWPIEYENLDQAVDDMIVTQGEERATGLYHCKLIGLDARGIQIALLPLRVNGKAPQALGAGAEQNALQRATSVALANAEQLLATQANHIEKISAIADSLLEDRTILVDEFNKAQSDNLDIQLRTQEWVEQQQFKKEAWEFIKEKVAPALLPAIGVYSENVQKERAEAKRLEDEKTKRKQAKFPPGWPGNGASPPTATQSSLRSPSAPPSSTPSPTAATDGSSPAARHTASPMESGNASASPADVALRAAAMPLQNQAGVSGPRGKAPPATCPGEPAAPPLAPKEAGNVEHEKPADGSGADRDNGTEKTQAHRAGGVPAKRRPRAPRGGRSTHKG